MIQKKNLIIINKEKIFQNEGNFYCDNIDMKTIPEELDKIFNTTFIATNSKIERSHKINLKNIKITSNLFNLFLNIFKTFKVKEANYLLISITPYTFFAYLFLFLFRKRTFVYLRSNGYEEYKAILGIFGPLIYYIMHKTVIFKSTIISCHKRLVKNKKYNLVYPSEIDESWIKETNKPLLDKPKLLYVGRIKIEKGILSLLKILKYVKSDISLSISGKDEGNIIIDDEKVDILGLENNKQKLIKLYDDHNITILPSFTEAHPKVVDESLARCRPVIIFEEIDYIIQNKHGIFVSKRETKYLIETINYIIKNYSAIQEKMKKNKLPKKENFISDLTKILTS